MAIVPPIIATLIADTKEYMAKMDEAQAKMAEFGGESSKASALFSSSTASIVAGAAGVGVAIGAYAVDAAMKFNEQMDKVRFQAGLTEEQTKALGNSILNISASLGVATSDLASGALTIEQAGLRGAAATKLLNDAAKASIITNASVADSTKAIVAAQTLQIAKGMDVTKLTGILVKGSQDFVGGLSAEEQMLQGRVGVALSNYGLKLQTVIALGSEFAKVSLPTRSISSFANALGNLEKPLTDSKGKLTSYAQGIDRAGLSLNKLVSDARTGNIVGILTQIKETAAQTGQPLSQVANAVFGTSAGSAASVLIKNLQQVAQLQAQLSGAGAGSLANQTQAAINTPAQQIKIFEQSLNKAMVNLGTVALPWVITGVKFGTKALSDIESFFNSSGWGELITGKNRTGAKVGRGQGVKDIAGSLWNSIVSTVEGVGQALWHNNFNQLTKTHQIPGFLYYNTGTNTPATSKTLTVNNTHHFK